jgi:hypothetical protein
MTVLLEVGADGGQLGGEGVGYGVDRGDVHALAQVQSMSLTPENPVETGVLGVPS